MASIGPGNTNPQYGGADYGYRTDRPVGADIPANQQAPAPSRGGLAGGAMALLALLIKFKGLALTFVSLVVSAAAYGAVFGWWAFGLGFALLILVHEFGHVVAARALRLPVSLPVLIPLFGAFAAVRQRPRTVAEEAQVAVAGPIVGALASVACYLGYLAAPATYWGGLLGGLAYFGFFVNLFNLVPVTPLDGGRVMSVLSRWFNVAGLAIAGLLLVWSGFSNPVLILVVIVGAFSTWQRFRSTRMTPDYYEVPMATKWTVGAIYLALLLGLVWGIELTHGIVASVR